MTWIDGLIDGLMDFVSVLRCLIHAHDVCERPRPSLPLTRGVQGVKTTLVLESEAKCVHLSVSIQGFVCT